MRFKPTRPDGRARWQVVYDLAVAAKPGEIINYSTLEKALETSDRSIIYRAAARATRKLWEKDQRSLDVEEGVGYRVLLPQEHEAQAKRYQRASRRRLHNALSVAQATDVTHMTEKEREHVVAFVNGLMLMAEAVDRHEKRLSHHESLLRDLERRMRKVEGDEE